MRVSTATKLAHQLMDQHGLIEKGWTFRISRATSCFGQCRQGIFGKKRKKIKEISLSGPLTEINTEVEVRDTILHEIAHAIVGPGHGHDWKWKQCCRKIGCRPNTTYSTDNVNIKVAAKHLKRTGRACTKVEKMTINGRKLEIGTRFRATFGSKFTVKELYTSRPKYPIIAVEDYTGKVYRIAKWQVSAVLTK